jgi:hypothetical protein
VNSGEYKLMGLAPYGEPRFADTIRDELIEVFDDGSFRLNLDYFSFTRSEAMTTERFGQLFRVLKEHVVHFNSERPHQGIGQRVPANPVAPSLPCPSGQVVVRPVLGGQHPRVPMGSMTDGSAR